MTPPFIASALLETPAVRHGFFGREGGVSRGIYASLNAGIGSKDDAGAVETNRARIAAAMAVAPERLVGLYQIHSARALRVSGPWETERPQADALVSTVPGLALCILAADCAPVLLADAEAGVIGAAHAGWQGALGGVIEATLDEMARAGARRERIRAAIGPCIGQASYEVGPEYVARFAAADPGNARFFAPGAGDRAHFDLKAYCRARLEGAGVRATDVLAPDTCAAADRYFSNRRAVKTGEPDYGRNASVITLA